MEIILSSMSIISLNTLSNPCSYKKSPRSISLQYYHTQDPQPLILPVHKIIERVVVDAYVYHKYYGSRCNLDIGAQRLMF